MKMRVEMKPIATILVRLGVDKNGDVQLYLTTVIKNRMIRHMPFSSGTMATKLTFVKSPTEIEVSGPYAMYQYYGKVMVNAETGRGPALIPGVGYRYRRGASLKVTNLDLQYDKTKNPRAGPFWDRALMANEGKAIAADVSKYARRKQ